MLTFSLLMKIECAVKGAERDRAAFRYNYTKFRRVKHHEVGLLCHRIGCISRG